MDIEVDDKATLHRIKFILLLVFQIAAIILSLIIFIFFIKQHRVLQNIQHKAILILFIVNFIQLTFDLPMAIHFYRFGYVYPSTSTYCTWWSFFEYSLDVIIALLMTVISIQRHILIFHENLFRTQIKRMIFYYFPLLMCIIYPLILYTIIILFYPCDGGQWSYTSNVCGFATCYLVYNKTLATFDWTAQNGMPTLIIILANVSLLLRVIKQKCRHQQRINWRKQRRITLQLLSISSLFLIAWLPSLIIGLVQQLFDPTFLVEIQMNYALDLLYVMCLLLPWVCLWQLPGFIQWIKAPLRPQENLTRTRNTVHPM